MMIFSVLKKKIKLNTLLTPIADYILQNEYNIYSKNIMFLLKFGNSFLHSKFNLSPALDTVILIF